MHWKGLLLYRPTPLGRFLIWCLCVVLLLGIASFRVSTEAEYAVASLAIIPIMTLAWMEGGLVGAFASVLSTLIWLVPDLQAPERFSAPWIPWVNALTHLLMYLIVLVLVVELRRLLERLSLQSGSDLLTGLKNRRAFFSTGGREMQRVKRYGRPLAIGFLDLDNFKALNDSQGHQAGDMALKATAEAIRQNLRATDVVARLGGDEFAILLPETDYQAATSVANKTHEAVTSALKAYPPVTASMGVACFSKCNMEFDEMLKIADGLMYESKKEMRGHVRVKEVGC